MGAGHHLKPITTMDTLPSLDLNGLGPLSATPHHAHVVSTRWSRLYQVAFVAVLLRIAFACLSERIHHPDEVFQYLEPAHRLVFGFGMIPWEYRYGTRSWVIPLFISAPLWLCKMCGADYPAVYIPLVKSILCVVSTSVVFSAYTIAKHLVSESAGRLAAI